MLRRAVLALLLVTLSRPAAADEPPPEPAEAARQVYDQGASAMAEKRFADAARHFAHADELLPNDTALSEALRAADLAADPVLGMELVERAEKRGGALADEAERLRAKLIGQVGRIDVRCPPGATCDVRIDRESASLARSIWRTSGDHVVELTIDGEAKLHAVRVPPGGVVTVPAESDPPHVPPPSPPSPPVAPPVVDPVPAKPDSGISPVFFWVGAGTTAVLGGLTIGFGVDALVQNAEFGETPTTTRRDDGQAAQLRTNVLIGVTAAAAIATGAVGVFAVDWGDEEPVVALSIGPDVTLRGRFE